MPTLHLSRPCAKGSATFAEVVGTENITGRDSGTTGASRTMGNRTSEYWTYALPRRQELARMADNLL
jgi:hypothetical protein